MVPCGLGGWSLLEEEKQVNKGWCENANPWTRVKEDQRHQSLMHYNKCLHAVSDVGMSSHSSLLSMCNDVKLGQLFCTPWRRKDPVRFWILMEFYCKPNLCNICYFTSMSSQFLTALVLFIMTALT